MSDEWTFKRVLVVEHKTHEISGTHVKEKLIILELSLFCIACRWKNRDRNCMFHYFCRARYDLDNLANGIFPCHKLQGVFTEVSECMYVVWNIKKANCFIFKCEWGWVCVCVYVCVCGVWWGGGCNDITESYGGDQVQLIIMNQNPPAPYPFPQVMNNDRPPFSYLFIYIYFYSFILFIYLFIHSLISFFFH